MDKDVEAIEFRERISDAMERIKGGGIVGLEMLASEPTLSLPLPNQLNI